MLAECLRAAGGRDGDVEPVSVGEGFLRAQLHDLDDERRPLWYPEDQIPQAGIDSSAALAAGLEFRSAEETARDCVAGTEGAGGLDPAAFALREHALLGAWGAATAGLSRT